MKKRPPIERPSENLQNRWEEIWAIPWTCKSNFQSVVGWGSVWLIEHEDELMSFDVFPSLVKSSSCFQHLNTRPDITKYVVRSVTQMLEMWLDACCPDGRCWRGGFCSPFPPVVVEAILSGSPVHQNQNFVAVFWLSYKDQTWVPTGMKTGVSTTECGRVISATLALVVEHLASTRNAKAEPSPAPIMMLKLKSLSRIVCGSHSHQYSGFGFCSPILPISDQFQDQDELENLLAMTCYFPAQLCLQLQQKICENWRFCS